MQSRVVVSRENYSQKRYNFNLENFFNHDSLRLFVFFKETIIHPFVVSNKKNHSEDKQQIFRSKCKSSHYVVLL